jgi:hypothetical protein
MANSTPDHPKAPVNPARSSSAGAAGAATARAPQIPVPAAEAPAAGKRRSDRVVLAIPIEISATDLHGIRFTEPCFTEMVSLHGASIALPRRVAPEHAVTVHRRALDLEIQARILGQLGIRPGFHVYGLTFTDDAPGFWGIHFPPISEVDNSMARTLLQCSACEKKVIFALNEIEFRVFDANQRLLQHCETCGHIVVWEPVLYSATPAETQPGVPALRDRKHNRTRMKAMACIRESGHPDDLVEVLDISRGGVSFRGTRAYEVNGWIHFAVPYTPAAANIFVSARVAWRKQLGDDHYEHGVQYVKG